MPKVFPHILIIMIFHRFSSWELWRYGLAWPSRLEQHIVSKHLIFCLPAVHSSTCHHFLLYCERFQKLSTQRTVKSYKTDHSNFLNSDLVLRAEIWLKVYQGSCLFVSAPSLQLAKQPAPSSTRCLGQWINYLASWNSFHKSADNQQTPNKPLLDFISHRK